MRLLGPSVFRQVAMSIAKTEVFQVFKDLGNIEMVFYLNYFGKMLG